MVKLSENKARQGHLGRPVLIILVISLLLALLVWGGVGLYGDAIAPEQPIGSEPQPADAQ